MRRNRIGGIWEGMEVYERNKGIYEGMELEVYQKGWGYTRWYGGVVELKICEGMEVYKRNITRYGTRGLYEKGWRYRVANKNEWRHTQWSYIRRNKEVNEKEWM